MSIEDIITEQLLNEISTELISKVGQIHAKKAAESMLDDDKYSAARKRLDKYTDIAKKRLQAKASKSMSSALGIK